MGNWRSLDFFVPGSLICKLGLREANYGMCLDGCLAHGSILTSYCYYYYYFIDVIAVGQGLFMYCVI